MATNSASTIPQIDASREFRRGESLTTKALRRIRKDKLTLFAGTVLILLLAFSISAPYYERLVGINHRTPNPALRFQGICIPALNIGTAGCNPAHVLGTDDLGRDVLARIMFGGQTSLGIAFLSAIFALILGISIGMIAGYNAGTRFSFIDDFINWVITTLTSIPTIYLLLIVSAVVRANPDLSRLLSGPWLLIIILSLLGWMGTARLVRGETLSIREREYILASRAIGASPVRVMAGHILPNVFSVVIIALATDIGGLILIEAALSFLGLGVSITTPSWGNMLNSAQNFYTRGAHLVILPGLFIFMAVLMLYILGDGIRDAFDPTARD